MAKKKTQSITWTNERRKLADLIPWEHNPRTIKQKQAERLVDSVETFGQVETLAIGPQNEIYNGHQRLSVLAGQYGMDYEVDVRVASRELTERERQQLTVYLHKGAAGEFDFSELANWGIEDDLLAWGFEPEELGFDFDEDDTEANDKISRSGRLYNAGDGHDVEPFKLAYRIEAAWKAHGHKALDLFSGAGQLAAWYRRRFSTVITVDKAYQHGDVDYSMSASDFIEKHLNEHLDFDYVDFDDEGCPGREIQMFFHAIAGKKSTPFVLSLTDGNGMNMKFRGKGNLAEMYMVDGESMRQLTRSDYDALEQTVTDFMQKVAALSGFSATALSSYRGREGNVLFQTWSIMPHDAG
jgi:hypothetical protein